MKRKLIITCFLYRGTPQRCTRAETQAGNEGVKHCCQVVTLTRTSLFQPPLFSSQPALNSASSVKKWIPSIKNEIEYYLQVSELLIQRWFLRTLNSRPKVERCLLWSFPSQQSQLSHYPERKIAQFQLHIETLEREYKSFIAKLRVLDPSCKHKPWTPRAYCKRRADAQHCPSIGQCV